MNNAVKRIMITIAMVYTIIITRIVDYCCKYDNDDDK